MRAKQKLGGTAPDSLERRCGEVAPLGDAATQLAVARVVVDERVRIEHVVVFSVIVGIRGVPPGGEHRLQTLQAARRVKA